MLVMCIGDKYIRRSLQYRILQGVSHKGLNLHVVHVQTKKTLYVWGNVFGAMTQEQEFLCQGSSFQKKSGTHACP